LRGSVLKTLTEMPLFVNWLKLKQGSVYSSLNGWHIDVDYVSWS